MRTKEKALIKAVFVISCLFISVALILIKNNLSQGYELSLYDAMSPATWALLILPVIWGFIIVVLMMFTQDGMENWSGIGLGLILLGNLVVVLLPALRGYAFSAGADHLSHMGMVTDILENGSFSSNIYPATHILIAEFSLITHTSAMTIIRFAGPFFYIFFVASTYLLSRQLLPKRAVALATASSTVLISYAYVNVFPMSFAFMIFPFFLHIYFKSLKEISFSFRILLISLIVFVVPFHVAASFVLLLVIVVMEVSKILLNMSFFARLFLGEFRVTSIPRASPNLAVINLTLLQSWMWAHEGVWRSSVLVTWRWLQGELYKTSMWEQASDAFVALQLQWWERVELFIRMYGAMSVFFILASFAAVLLITNKTFLALEAKRDFLILSLIFGVIAFINLVDLSMPVTILSPGRLLWVLASLAPPLVGLSLYQISGLGHRNTKSITSERQHSTLMRSIPIALTLVLCSMVGIFGIYESPLTHLPNTQVTHMEFDGYKWLLQNGSQEIKVTSIMARIFRFQHAAYGTLLPGRLLEKERFDDHFNYTQFRRYGDSIDEDTYLPISQYTRLIYTKLWPAARFSYEDFTRLDQDSTIDEIYTSKEMAMYYVIATGHRL